MKKQAMTLVAKALGMTTENGKLTCSGRPGTAYVRIDSTPCPVAFDARTKKPLVLSCEHEALELIQRYMQALLFESISRALVGDLLNMPYVPDPEDFFYVFADEEPELEVTSTADAEAVIAAVKGL